MSFVKVSTQYGIIVREAALLQRGVSRKDLLAAFETGAPSAEGAGLLSFGPHFGGDAAEELCRRLTSLGLQYFDDFFDLAIDAPGWLNLAASCNPEN